MDQFATRMTDLRNDWDNLDAAQRDKRIQEAIDEASQSAGVPSPEVKFDSMATGRNGQFSNASWRIEMSSNMNKHSKMKDSDFAALSDTLYHELRHCEQFFLVAGLYAADGHPDTTINAVAPGHARKAKNAPIGLGHLRRRCAEVMERTFYGADRNHREAVLLTAANDRIAFSTAEAAYVKALSEYNAKKSSRFVSLADKKAAYNTAVAALNQMNSAHAAHITSYTAYTNLPEEADAFDVGGKMEKLTAAKLKAPKATPVSGKPPASLPPAKTPVTPNKK